MQIPHRRVVTPAMVVVLLAGLYLASARWQLSMTWINASLTLLIVIFAIVGAVTVPTLRRLTEAPGPAAASLGAARARLRWPPPPSSSSSSC